MDLELLVCGESQLGPCIGEVAYGKETWYAGVAKPGQRDPFDQGSWKRRPEAPVP
jgi:hypothetical protein